MSCTLVEVWLVWRVLTQLFLLILNLAVVANSDEFLSTQHWFKMAMTRVRMYDRVQEKLVGDALNHGMSK